jgi:hypothetical protein
MFLEVGVKAAMRHSYVGRESKVSSGLLRSKVDWLTKFAWDENLWKEYYTNNHEFKHDEPAHAPIHQSYKYTLACY